jgi:DNA-binding MarR family transcriptional regulator
MTLAGNGARRVWAGILRRPPALNTAGSLPNRYHVAMASTAVDATAIATELMTAMTRLRARLRSESAPGDMRWTWSQLAALGRIVAEGPATTTDLAQAEHVRRQSMTETVAALRAGGLVESRPDPSDGRKTLIAATRKGRELTQAIPATREAWLGLAVDSTLSRDERQTLREAAAIMSRLADSAVPGS